MNVEKMLLKCEFEQWLYDEAQLLDDIEFDDWFDLMHSSSTTATIYCRWIAVGR